MSLNNKRKASSGLSVICTNVTEPCDTLLQARHKRELEEWFKLCAKMKLKPIEPLSLTRLSRPPNSPHNGTGAETAIKYNILARTHRTVTITAELLKELQQQNPFEAPRLHLVEISTQQQKIQSPNFAPDANSAGSIANSTRMFHYDPDSGLTFGL
ncbi:hypothetical protein T265_11712 [Opisthorchis viverrini]|uniref:Uncharacterized protein n=1 Tax=Opisthorchis viverrini TaxID=6198 RepID=A0A074ZWH5_OPIVI|nr:hypothetical protein T265_11712 [Opisthorchis viverrini]KER19544.1 hypothetical protein T265_11712 [Opisthorchis viverrini]